MSPSEARLTATGEQREREVVAWNFRDSGLLSNESTRYLRGLHDGFAKAVSHSLDLFLGTPLELKLERIEQVGLREFASQLGSSHYLLPVSLAPLPERAVVCLDVRPLFRLLDLLLGGSGEVLDLSREVTEIDEELFHSVTEIVYAQLERAWRSCEVSVARLPSLRAAAFQQLFATEDRLLVLRFVLRLGETEEDVVLILPATFAAALVQSGESEDRGSGVEAASTGKRLESRLLDCQMTVTVDLCDNVVPLGALVALQRGTVLDLGTSAASPIQLRVDGFTVFDAMPVKSGRNKAAQLVRECTTEEVQ